MILRDIKKALQPLLHTPLHPQWLVCGRNLKLIEWLKGFGGDGIVLDIGCAGCWPERFLPGNCHYVGLDYPETATEWYRTAPDIFADAGRLPIATQSVDVALLLDVLEHLDSVDHAIEEIARILKPGGRLLLQVPFLYPLHDEPRDFTRLSRHGISNLLQRYGLVVEHCLAVGTPMETAGLLTNIAISKVAWDWVSRKSPLMPLILMIPFFVVIINLAAKVLSWLAYDNDFMPFSYQVSASKPH